MSKNKQERYLKQLVSAMEEIFIEKYNVNPSVVGVHPDEVIERTKLSIQGEQLYRCLMCDALIEYILDKDMFERGGSLHNLALKIHKKLDTNKLYSFPIQGAVCSYDEDKDCLIPDKKRSKPKACAFCSGIPVSLHWGGKTVTEEIAWFQSETDNTLDSNVFEVAQNLVQKHFPGEFGSERMVQQVVDSILAQSAASLKEGGATQRQDSEKPMDTFNPETASKIILTGFKKKTMHKEELVKSEKEKQVMLTLVKDVTYSELRKLMYDAVGVQADCQKIRIGFPPKLLEGNEDTLLDIKHGDKITLEVLLDKAPDVKICEEASGHSEASWRGFEEDAHSQTAEKLLQALRDVDHGGDSIDTSIASLGILSAVSGKDMWTNVQSMPHLFSVGGLLYQQVKRDLGLIDGKHCQLPCLPGKVEPRIEAQVMEGLRTDARSQAKFGASGAVHQPSDRAAFSAYQSFPHLEQTHLTNPYMFNSESAKLPVGYQRLAPGYSVIDPDRTKEDNSNIEMFRSLAEHIEKTLAENMEEACVTVTIVMY
ncbi:VCIP1-like protein [Mya arenaria]|uniref:VCIP1-like protein n=1 Tax=Mya arenaria TaxID=6604 RepID=A0ABY7DZX6_MYAAR|nr:VCIP1-like protein [Mya arenaria]